MSSRLCAAGTAFAVSRSSARCCETTLGQRATSTCWSSSLLRPSRAGRSSTSRGSSPPSSVGAPSTSSIPSTSITDCGIECWPTLRSSMQHDDLVYVGDMYDFAVGIARRADGLERKVFDEDENLRLAIVQLLGWVGSAARRVSPEFRESHSEIPWALAVGM